ncbi:MAG: hypothetical protein JO356_01400, partial [Acidobacteria bacterium]|nr:hypothetical protein [Acidobacteriota bacterium]
MKPVIFLALWAAMIMAISRSSGEKHSIAVDDWGRITAPVYETSETGVYSGAELFAGPNKFGSYFAGVLPNGRMVKPAGVTTQIGMNPLGAALTPDGKYLITTNDDERDLGFPSYQSSINSGGYSLSVIDTRLMKVVSQLSTGKYFLGLEASGTGPYTVWASGGGDNDVKLFTLEGGVLTPAKPKHIVISPITPATEGFVSHYTADERFSRSDAEGFPPPAPSGFSRSGETQITFPAGMALSPDGKYLYVACNGDNSVAVIETTSKAVVKQVPVGYFPYAVVVNSDGTKILVSNWGITEYKFAHPLYDPESHRLLSTAAAGNLPYGFYIPRTNASEPNPKTSSISVLDAPSGDARRLSLREAVYEGHALDELYNVGDTHPSAATIIHGKQGEVLYVTKSNSDSLGMVLLNGDRKLEDLDLSLNPLGLDPEHHLHGEYPNAIVAAPAQDRLYVAEAGINSVAVVDTRQATHPALLARIPTDWYPSALAITADGSTLYVVNAKGVGEDINPRTATGGSPPPTGLGSDPNTDSNYIFGSLQRINLAEVKPGVVDVLNNNFAFPPPPPASSQIVPLGGNRASKKIKHVFFILHENKTFDSMLGNLGSHFGPYASLTYNASNGSNYRNMQFTGVSLNTQLLASHFA